MSSYSSRRRSMPSKSVSGTTLKKSSATTVAFISASQSEFNGRRPLRTSKEANTFEISNALAPLNDLQTTIQSSTFTKETKSLADELLKQVKTILIKLSKSRSIKKSMKTSFWKLHSQIEEIIEAACTQNKKIYNPMNCIEKLKSTKKYLSSLKESKSNLSNLDQGNTALYDMFLGKFDEVIESIYNYGGSDPIKSISDIIRQVNSLKKTVPTSKTQQDVQEVYSILISIRNNINSAKYVKTSFSKFTDFYQKLLSNLSADISDGKSVSKISTSRRSFSHSQFSRTTQKTVKSSEKTVILFTESQEIQSQIKSLEQKIRETRIKISETQKQLAELTANHEKELQKMENKKSAKLATFSEDDPRYPELQELEDKCDAYRRFIHQKQKELSSKQQQIQDSIPQIHKYMELSEQKDYYKYISQITKERYERIIDRELSNARSNQIGGEMELSLDADALEKEISYLKNENIRAMEKLENQIQTREVELKDSPEIINSKLQEEALAIAGWETRVHKELDDVTNAIQDLGLPHKIDPTYAKKLRHDDQKAQQVLRQLHQELDQFDEVQRFYAQQVILNSNIRKSIRIHGQIENENSEIFMSQLQELEKEIREMKEAQRQMKAEIDEIHAAVYSEEE